MRIDHWLRMIIVLPRSASLFIKTQSGLPWWLRGQAFACHCRRHGLHPWFRKIPHAGEHLSPRYDYWASALDPWNIMTEPPCGDCWNLCTPEPLLGNKRSYDSESPHRRTKRGPRALATTREGPGAATSTQHSPRRNKSIKIKIKEKNKKKSTKVLQCRWLITAAIVTRGVKGEREGEEGTKEKEEELEQAEKTRYLDIQTIWILKNRAVWLSFTSSFFPLIVTSCMNSAHSTSLSSHICKIG